MDEDAYKKYNKAESGAKPGVYKHENTKEELHATSHPAADAYVRQGWVYDRPLPAKEEVSAEQQASELIQNKTNDKKEGK